MSSDLQEQERQPSPAFEGQARAEIDVMMRPRFELRVINLKPIAFLVMTHYLLPYYPSGTSLPTVDFRQTPSYWQFIFHTPMFEVKGIRNKLVVAEAECIDIDKGQADNFDVYAFIISAMTPDSQQATQRPFAAAGQSEMDLETAIANDMMYGDQRKKIFRTRVANKARDGSWHVAD
jgi:hypothetical protein